jgi:ferric-dicitrate binding protein FerR (iron transport regulator)
MEKHYSDIGRILSRYPEITPDENAVLQEWLNKDHNSQIFEELTSREGVVQMLKRAEEIRATQGEKWQKLLNTIDTIQPEKASRRRVVVFWLSAAASVILIAGVLLYTMSSHKNKGSSLAAPTVATTNNDVKPGQFKAKLTLADGSTIILDSAKNGQLAQEGGTNVLTKDGKLIYEKSAETNKVLYNTLSTAKAQTYATVLSDGTKVWLNSESSIHYPVAFTGDVRKIEITGEAYFEVATSIGKNGKRPFIVNVNGMEVEVLGTHFNIMAYDEEPDTKVTLIEGSVRVSKGFSMAMLKPGQQALTATGNTATGIRINKEADIEEAIAWKEGNFQFNHADLQTVMRQIGRWYDVDVSYEGKVPEKRFTGRMSRNMKASEVLSGIEFIGVHFKIEGKKIVVLP